MPFRHLGFGKSGKLGLSLTRNAKRAVLSIEKRKKKKKASAFSLNLQSMHPKLKVPKLSMCFHHNLHEIK